VGARARSIYRELRAWYEDRVETVESMEGGRIARARFALDGHSSYPDATARCGSRRQGGRLPAAHHQRALEDHVVRALRSRPELRRPASFDVPERVTQARGRLELAGPLNFVCTSDIIGGNSGSPVLSRDLACVGLVFDGNVQAFRWEFDYDEAQGRTVAVDSAAILESLRKIYDMARSPTSWRPRGSRRSPRRPATPPGRHAEAPDRRHGTFHGPLRRSMPAPSIRRIAITTGGGDAPGLNAVIRAVALASLHRGWECVGIRDGFDGLLEPGRFPEGGLASLTRAAVAGISHLAAPSSAPPIAATRASTGAPRRRRDGRSGSLRRADRPLPRGGHRRAHRGGR